MKHAIAVRFVPPKPSPVLIVVEVLAFGPVATHHVRDTRARAVNESLASAWEHGKLADLHGETVPRCIVNSMAVVRWNDAMCTAGVL